MPKTYCKALRKDGLPCQGQALPDFDGLCIAHVPPDVASEWRSRGGKASSTAARADKRIPERLRSMIDKLSQGMEDVIEGKLEPAALSALSRAAKVLIELHRLADEEMETIRADESAAAAAQVAGVTGDPAILDAADAITDWQQKYTLGSLIDQGLVTLHQDGERDTGEPPLHVLTSAGRQRFRYQRLTNYLQQDINGLKQEAADSLHLDGALPELLIDIHRVRLDLEETLTDFAPDAPPVLDPLTGQTLSQLPFAVKPALTPAAGPAHAAQAAEEAQNLLRQVNELARKLEKLYEKETGNAFHYQFELRIREGGD